MKIRVAIPHYYRASSSEHHASSTVEKKYRIQAVRRTICQLVQHFGQQQYQLQFIGENILGAKQQNSIFQNYIDIVIVTNGSDHLVSNLDIDNKYFTHNPISIQDPRYLGYHCRKILSSDMSYDYYCYMEDDLSINDPLFFQKIRWFNSLFGDESVLLPHRYERSINKNYDKIYIDADNTLNSERLVGSVEFMNIPFHFISPPMNPHSGCYFLNSEQIKFWMKKNDFMDFSDAYISPLESAATLSLNNNFRVFKPSWENAAFFEIEHFGDCFLSSVKSM